MTRESTCAVRPQRVYKECWGRRKTKVPGKGVRMIAGRDFFMESREVYRRVPLKSLWSLAHLVQPSQNILRL